MGFWTFRDLTINTGLVAADWNEAFRQMGDSSQVMFNEEDVRALHFLTGQDFGYLLTDSIHEELGIVLTEYRYTHGEITIGTHAGIISREEFQMPSRQLAARQLGIRNRAICQLLLRFDGERVQIDEASEREFGRPRLACVPPQELRERPRRIINIFRRIEQTLGRRRRIERQERRSGMTFRTE